MTITAGNNLNILMADVSNVKKKLEREKNKAVLARRSWDKVRQSRMHFTVNHMTQLVRASFLHQLLYLLIETAPR